MSTDPYASIGYGYSLGSSEGWKVTTLASGWHDPTPHPAWYVENAINDDPDATDEDRLSFDDQTIRHLFNAIPETQRPPVVSDYDRRGAVKAHYGVTVKRSGTYKHPGWLLVAADSVQTVEWAEVIDVTAATEATEAPSGAQWRDGLSAAVTALGGPEVFAQNGPRWLAWPEYR